MVSMYYERKSRQALPGLEGLMGPGDYELDTYQPPGGGLPNQPPQPPRDSSGNGGLIVNPTTNVPVAPPPITGGGMKPGDIFVYTGADYTGKPATPAPPPPRPATPPPAPYTPPPVIVNQGSASAAMAAELAANAARRAAASYQPPVVTPPPPLPYVPPPPPPKPVVVTPPPVTSVPKTPPPAPYVPTPVVTPPTPTYTSPIVTPPPLSPASTAVQAIVNSSNFTNVGITPQHSYARPEASGGSASDIDLTPAQRKQSQMAQSWVDSAVSKLIAMPRQASRGVIADRLQKAYGNTIASYYQKAVDPSASTGERYLAAKAMRDALQGAVNTERNIAAISTGARNVSAAASNAYSGVSESFTSSIDGANDIVSSGVDGVRSAISSISMVGSGLYNSSAGGVKSFAYATAAKGAGQIAANKVYDFLVHPFGAKPSPQQQAQQKQKDDAYNADRRDQETLDEIRSYNQDELRRAVQEAQSKVDSLTPFTPPNIAAIYKRNLSLLKSEYERKYGDDSVSMTINPIVIPMFADMSKTSLMPGEVPASQNKSAAAPPSYDSPSDVAPKKSGNALDTYKAFRQNTSAGLKLTATPGYWGAALVRGAAATTPSEIARYRPGSYVTEKIGFSYAKLGIRRALAYLTGTNQAGLPVAIFDLSTMYFKTEGLQRVAPAASAVSSWTRAIVGNTDLATQGMVYGKDFGGKAKLATFMQSIAPRLQAALPTGYKIVGWFSTSKPGVLAGWAGRHVADLMKTPGMIGTSGLVDIGRIAVTGVGNEEAYHEITEGVLAESGASTHRAQERIRVEERTMNQDALQSRAADQAMRAKISAYEYNVAQLKRDLGLLEQPTPALMDELRDKYSGTAGYNANQMRVHLNAKLDPLQNRLNELYAKRDGSVAQLKGIPGVY